MSEAMNEFVTVATFPEPATANMARMALESAGIAVFVQGEQANSLIPVAFEAKLQVREEDEAKAREVLSSSDLTPFTMAEVTAAEIAAEKGE